jgi:tetratricopeptide (TPR) repeat protein
MKKLLLALILCSLASPILALSQAEIQDAYYKSYNYEKMGNVTDAINALSLVIKEYPTGYTANLRLGYLQLIAKHYSNAIENYDKAILTVPASIEPKLGKMSVLIAQGRYTEAEQIGYQVLNSDYNNYYANIRLSYCLRMDKKADLAEKIDIKMLTLLPTDTAYLVEYALVKYAQANYSKSYTVFQDVLILEPENVTAKYYIQLMNKAAVDAKAATVNKSK